MSSMPDRLNVRITKKDRELINKGMEALQYPVGELVRRAVRVGIPILMQNPTEAAGSGNFNLNNLFSAIENHSDQAVLLMDPRLGLKRRAVNHLAALVLTTEYPTRLLLMEKTSSSRQAISDRMGYLLTAGLVEVVERKQISDPAPRYYAPTPALQWAATRPDIYTDLAHELSGLGYKPSDLTIVGEV